MILKDVKVSQSPKQESQERRPVAIGLNRGFLSHCSLILYFVKADEGWSVFVKSRVRYEWSRSLDLDFIPESIVGYPIMSDPAGSLPEPNPEHDLESVLHPVPNTILSGIHELQPASTRVAHNLSLLPHVGTVIRFPVRCTLYGLFKPLLMIARDMPRFRMSMVLSSFMRVPLGYLSSDEGTVKLWDSEQVYASYETMAN